jgi:prefoldin subunit 5
MVVMEYQTVEQLYSLAILQGQRAENVKNGRITLQVFINNTVTSLRAALKAAQSASGEFQASSGAFDQVVVIIQKNIDEIAEKIKKINENIDLNNKALRDKIIWEVADTVAIVFSTAALIASLGASSAVVAVVTTATRLGLGAAAIASGIKLVIDSLDLDELIKTIQALKQSRTDLQTSLENLTAVKPFFEKVVTGVDALASTVDDMALSIQIISDNVDLWKETTLTTEDVTTIHDSWIDIQNDCLNWMDMVHSQGINPVTKSLEV